MMQRPGEAPLKPIDAVRPRDNLDFGLAFMQQRAGFEGALPTTDDQYLLSSELAKVAVRRGMRRQRSRNGLKFARLIGKRAYANSYYDTD
jgi:hypothetical protein